MPSLSFRGKLFLAMTSIVVGVTAAALIVTGGRVEATYVRLEDEQFDREMDSFAERQKAWLDGVSKDAREAAQSVRIVSAIEAGEPDVIYLLLTTELEELPGRPGAARADGGAASRPFYRVLDARGRVIEPPPDLGGEPGGALPAPPFRVSSSLSKTQALILRRAFDAAGGDPQRQQFGFLPLESDGARPRLLQTVLTPIVSRATGDRLGALVLGSLHDEPAVSHSFPIGGLWLAEQIYSSSLPEEARADFAGEILGRIRAGSLNGDFPYTIGDVPHRAFFQVLNPGSPFPTAARFGLYSLAAARKEMRDLQVRIGLVGGLAFLAALGVILIVSRGLTGPVQDLVAGTDRIRRGDFSVRVPVRTRDEMGQLASSFNEMAAGLALTRKYHTLLGQVTDPRVAERLLSGDAEAVLGGEVRDVSVVFCDIRGFTSMTEKMPPADVVTLLNEHMTLLTRVVHDHRGVVDKFVGDLLMAVFGAPEDIGDPARSAMSCASEMIEAREALNARSAITVAVGIGIASGPALAGCVGSSDRLEYTVMGATVNLASRLCDHAGRGEVLMDESTRARLGKEIDAAALDTLSLKGFSEPVRAWRLIGRASFRAAQH